MTKKTCGMHHVALNVQKFEECVYFYTHFLGMTVEWQPDQNSVYLTSGNDNLALHRTNTPFSEHKNPKKQHLGHIGFILESPEAVDEWHKHFVENNISIKTHPKTHRDGARSFYCLDPDGNCVQLIFHLPLSARGKQ